MDGIFGGGNPIVNTRDFQWKAFTPIQLNMDGWGANPKTPFSFDQQTTAINRAYNKQKTMLMPYNYTASAQSVFDGKPMVRGLFLDYPNIPEAYTDLVKYEYLWGDNFLVARFTKTRRLMRRETMCVTAFTSLTSSKFGRLLHRQGISWRSGLKQLRSADLEAAGFR